jgi:hypothetical protein
MSERDDIKDAKATALPSESILRRLNVTKFDVIPRGLPRNCHAISTFFLI